MPEENNANTVRLSGIVNESVTDGPGIRIVLFFQGCKHFCPGCHNPQTWDCNGGSEYEVGSLLEQLPVNPLIKGITLSGGDPFYQPLPAIQIANAFHTRGKDVWAYTGFTWEELLKIGDMSILELLKCCDVLVDGPFIQVQRSLNLPYRGSANQRLILVSESLERGQIIEWHNTTE